MKNTSHPKIKNSRFVRGFLLLMMSTCTALGVSPVLENFVSTTLSGDTLIAIDTEGDLYSGNLLQGDFSLRLNSGSDRYSDVEAVGNIAVAVGVDGQIVRSSNGGTSWVSANAPILFGDLNAVAGKSGTQEWLAVGFDGFNGTILRSTNGGTDWASVQNNLSNISLSDVVWTGSAWIAIGSDENSLDKGVLYRSTDGQNWVSIGLPSNAQRLGSLAVANGTIVTVGESGEILRSSDGGLTFSRIGGGATIAHLTTVFALSNADFVIGGSEGLILHVSGSSVSVTKQSIAGSPAVSDFVQSTSGQVFYFGLLGELDRSSVVLNVSFDASNLGSPVLRLETSIIGKSYRLETSTDLTSWTTVGGSVQVGNGSTLEFSLPALQATQYWRIIEF